MDLAQSMEVLTAAAAAAGNERVESAVRCVGAHLDAVAMGCPPCAAGGHYNAGAKLAQHLDAIVLFFDPALLRTYNQQAAMVLLHRLTVAAEQVAQQLQDGQR